MARLFRFLLIALLLIAAGCAQEKSTGPQHRRLPNGLTIIAKEHRAADVVSVQVWVRDGAIYEAPSDAGVSDLVSKAVFGGTVIG